MNANSIVEAGRWLRRLGGALGIGLVLCRVCANAAVIVESMSATPGLTIPDGSLVGISHTLTMPGTIASITEVSVTLDVQGGFTGDLYGYLQHGSGISILLNRPGRTGNSGVQSLGYLDGGLDITLKDSAANGDIHGYRTTVNPAGGVLTGIWQPDGRSTSPLSVVGTEDRDAMLSSFDGTAVEGEWVLFLADLSAGGISVLDGWSLEISGVAVPEPGGWSAAVAAALTAWGVSRRVFRARVRRGGPRG